MATIYKRKEDKGKPNACWYFGYKDDKGKQRKKKGYTDRKSTRELAEKTERDARRRRDGLVDPSEEKLAEQRKSAVVDVVNLYEKNLQSRRTTGKHVSLTLSRVRRIITGCNFQTLSEIETETVQSYLDELAEQEDFGHRTYNHYVQAIDGFGNWLVSTKRAAFNPFAGLTRLNVEVDIRHPRRALTVEEVGRLIASARASGKSIQCFTPEERARIYIISALRGLRRKEIASLTPRSFSLKADPPTVTVQAACSKHRKTDVLPLHPQLVAMLPGWLKGLAADQLIFPKLAKRRTLVNGEERPGAGRHPLPERGRHRRLPCGWPTHLYHRTPHERCDVARSKGVGPAHGRKDDDEVRAHRDWRLGKGFGEPSVPGV